MSNEDIETQVNKYYSEAFGKFGATPKGVDWNSEQSQHTRFDRLLKHLKIEPHSRILDFGCGYGELLKYMRNQQISCQYEGYDLVDSSIEAARKSYSRTGAKFVTSLSPEMTWDFVVMSGVFNVKGDLDFEKWTIYAISKIQFLLNKSEKGLSFNMLTGFNDFHMRKNHLYYSEPQFFVSKLELKTPFTIIVDHSYPMWEYTVTIFK